MKVQECDSVEFFRISRNLVAYSRSLFLFILGYLLTIRVNIRIAQFYSFSFFFFFLLSSSEYYGSQNIREQEVMFTPPKPD